MKYESRSTQFFMCHFCIICTLIIIKNKIKKQTNVVNIVSDGTTALHRACQLSNDKMVKLLLRNGADANVGDNKTKRLRSTTMHWAAWHGNLKIIKLLIKYQFNCPKLINAVLNINQPPYNLMSVFLILCSNGNVKCMEYLYSNYGKLIETQTIDRWGHNGIYLAVANEHLSMLKFLFTNVYKINRLRNDILNNTSRRESASAVKYPKPYYYMYVIGFLVFRIIIII